VIFPIELSMKKTAKQTMWRIRTLVNMELSLILPDNTRYVYHYSNECIITTLPLVSR